MTTSAPASMAPALMPPCERAKKRSVSDTDRECKRATESKDGCDVPPHSRDPPVASCVGRCDSVPHSALQSKVTPMALSQGVGSKYRV